MSDQWTPLNVLNLTNALVKVTNLRQLGLQLKLHSYEIDHIEHDYRMLADQKSQMYQKWLDRNPDASWEDILNALWQLGLHEIAREVKMGFGYRNIKNQPFRPDWLQLKPGSQLYQESPLHQVSPSHRGSQIHQESQSRSELQSQLESPSNLKPQPSEQYLVSGKQSHLPLAASDTEVDHSAAIHMSGEDKLKIVELEVEKLEGKFRKLVFTAQVVLIEKESCTPHFLSKLRTHVALLPAAQKQQHMKFLQEQRAAIISATNVDEIFYILSLYWSFINSSLLQHLISEFGDDQLKTKLLAYLDELKVFEENTNVKDFIHVRRSYLDLPPNFSEVAVKLKDEWADYSLSRVHELCQELSEISSLNTFSTIFTGGSFNSIHLRLAVPSSTLHLLAAALNDRFLHDHRIEVIHIKGVELHHYQRQCGQRSLRKKPKKVTPPPEALVEACRDGDVMKTLRLLDEGADINASAKVDTEYGKKVHTPFTISSMMGHSDIVNVLLCSGAEVNKPNGDPEYRWTPLMWACVGGHVPVVHILLEYHADVNIHSEKGGSTALGIASINDHPETVHLLLKARAEVDARDEVGRVALMEASSAGYLDVVQLLLAQGADVNLQDKDGRTALMRVSSGGYLDVTQLLLAQGANMNLQDEDGRTALMRASSKGYLDVVQLLLAQGANVDLQDEFGRTALMRASSEGYLDVIQLLLAQGANMDLQDRYGLTAVFKASMSGHSSVVQQLLQGGADPNTTTEEGLTPLIAAIKVLGYSFMEVQTESRISTVEVLLNGKASVEIQEQSTGWKALFFAANEGILEIVRLLIQHGANPSDVDKQGLTPLDVARDRRHSDVCKELEKFLTMETKETHCHEAHSKTEKPDSKEHLTTESQEAHSPTQQSHSEITEPGSEALMSLPGVEETTPKGVLPETESNRSKSVRRRMEEAGRQILAVFERLQERLLQSEAEKTRTLTEQQEIPYPGQKQHLGKEQIELQKVQD